MKIVKGRKYITRSGEIVEIVKYYFSSLYPYTSNKGITYTKDGRVYTCKDNPADLVKEYNENDKREMIELNFIGFDSKWNYIAQDKDGQICLFKTEPEISCEWWDRSPDYSLLDDDIKINFNTPWDKTLHQIVRIGDKTYLKPVDVVGKVLPNLEVDTKILVRQTKETDWKKRYFKKWDDKGHCVCFDNGATSWTTNQNTIPWKFWKLPEDCE